MFGIFLNSERLRAICGSVNKPGIALCLRFVTSLDQAGSRLTVKIMRVVLIMTMTTTARPCSDSTALDETEEINKDLKTKED
jgi:hypothetical protein